MKMLRLFCFLLSLILIFSLDIYANNDFCPFFEWPNMMMRSWGGMFVGLFFLLIIGLIVYLMVKSARITKSESIPKEKTPLEILKRRYAMGEINKEEYESIRKDLQS